MQPTCLLQLMGEPQVLVHVATLRSPTNTQMPHTPDLYEQLKNSIKTQSQQMN